MHYTESYSTPLQSLLQFRHLLPVGNIIIQIFDYIAALLNDAASFLGMSARQRIPRQTLRTNRTVKWKTTTEGSADTTLRLLTTFIGGIIHYFTIDLGIIGPPKF